ncbi:MAG TPA: HAMP domain-containing sensor histidine kinase [Jatrophihabitans sp.]|jgi:signal transduction histidine kinase|nr:HAMP domain-containing sensor histidine kinase [Jatrophihabitans sp.]
MLVIASSRARGLVAAGWLLFASINAALMYLEPGKETIPYHLIWASFALLYGLASWPLAGSVVVFAGITVVTGVPLVMHARNGYIGWEECAEIVLMGVIAALLMWHVRRSLRAQERLNQERLADQERAQRRELASRFGSHELRTRLTLARSVIDLIRSRAGEDGVRTDADLAIAELDKAVTTATNLLALVRFDGMPRIRAIAVDDLIEDIGRRWEIRADRIWTFTAERLTIDADPDRIEVALDCLIENAVKFTEEYDSITVTARAERDDVVFVVEDSGTGIPPRDIERVTELFETSSAAGSRAGTGLGLAIVRSVAESRGGSVTTTSSLGEGTRVAMRIPCQAGGERYFAATSGLPTTWAAASEAS